MITDTEFERGEAVIELHRIAGWLGRVSTDEKLQQDIRNIADRLEEVEVNERTMD